MLNALFLKPAQSAAGMSKGRKNSPKAPKRQKTVETENGGPFFTAIEDGANDNPIAALRNTGNNCYLNSILYVLRFTSRFCHNLHHVVDESQKLIHYNSNSDTKTKSSSLGRNAASSYGSSWRSSSTKDLPSLSLNDSPKSKVQIVTEKLHELFTCLRNIEQTQKCSNGTYVPSGFIEAVRDANPNFIMKNDQQDAHELLLHLFDNIRDTCATDKKHRNLKVDHKDDENDVEKTNGRKKNFIVEDFSGITLQTTKCFNCEEVTMIKELFYEISLPIIENDYKDLDEAYRKACLSKEVLKGNNKYFCNYCRHHEEALRSTSFECLPNIMIMQQKRFMHTNEGFQKVNTFMPTPLKLKCFCEECTENPERKKDEYILSGIVMHVGSTMQSGHYKAYVRASNHLQDYYNCPRQLRKIDKKSMCNLFNFNVFSKFKAAAANERRTNDLSSSGGGAMQNFCESKNCCGIKVHAACLEEDDMWLECNDDKITPISEHSLELELSDKSNRSNTPYLLFYEKIRSCVVGKNNCTEE